MNTRRANPRLVKIHRSYTVEEVARLIGRHKQTVREWIKAGLPTCDSKRPALIQGRALQAFLYAKRAAHKRHCGPGEMYCLRCREPRKPSGGMVDCQPVTATLGNLIGICPACECLMHRRVNLLKAERLKVEWGITFPQGP